VSTEQPELDTIVAPATPLGRGALAIVRIDGPRSAAILRELGGSEPEERRATFTQLTHDGDLLDECVAVRYAAPHSFTGNDLVELTLHGSPSIVERVITAAIALGARMAQAGEFTERAVLNGKLDLVQAESISDLINSRTALQARLSLSNLHGVLSRRATAVRDALLHLISRLEAALDFSEEGYEFITRDETRRVVAQAMGRPVVATDHGGARDELAGVEARFLDGETDVLGLRVGLVAAAEFHPR